MKILTPPNNQAICKKCKAKLKFECDDVETITHRGKHGGIYKAIICPCCTSVVRVWEEESIEGSSENKESPFYGLGGSI